MVEAQGTTPKKGLNGMNKKEFVNRTDKNHSLAITAGKNIKEDTAQLAMAFIEYDEETDQYIAKGYVSNNPHEQLWKHQCDTKDKAIELLHELGEMFPPSKDIDIVFGWCENG